VPDEQPLVLIVEDSRVNQMLIKEVLEMAGYRYEFARLAAEARAFLAQTKPDLILMDIQLPDQDGISLTRDLKADAATADIPVVALSGRSMDDDKRLALEAGCIDYIVKPIDIGTFKDSLDRALGRGA
jgi:two-component system cell cycle response regulator DivK